MCILFYGGQYLTVGISSFSTAVIHLKNARDVLSVYDVYMVSELAHCRDKECCGSIVAAEFDSSTKFFVACTDCKQLLVWNVEDGWKLQSTRFVELVMSGGP